MAPNQAEEPAVETSTAPKQAEEAAQTPTTAPNQSEELGGQETSTAPNQPAAMVPKQVRTYDAKIVTPEAESWLKANKKGKKKVQAEEKEKVNGSSRGRKTFRGFHTFLFSFLHSDLNPLYRYLRLPPLVSQLASVNVDKSGGAEAVNGGRKQRSEGWREGGASRQTGHSSHRTRPDYPDFIASDQLFFSFPFFLFD